MDLKDLYTAHVDRLCAEYGRAIEESELAGLVVHSGAMLAKSSFDDQYWPLKVTPTFAHWLPLAEADCALVIVPGARPRLLRNRDVSYWEGPVPTESGHFWDAFDLSEVESEAMSAEIGDASKLAFVGDDSDRAEAWGVPDANVNPPALVDELHAIRAIKSEYERQCIAEANARGARGHVRVFSEFAEQTRSELDLHLAYLDATDQDDAETPYKNIVAHGRHAAVLHHVYYSRDQVAGGSLLVDAGATFCGYASDITRTAVRGKNGAELFSELIDRMEALQQELCARVRPGLSFEALHDQAHELLAGVLIDLGIAKATKRELVDNNVTRTFLPHGLGHSLGIQVHDVGCKTKPPETRNPYLRNTSDIEVGHVFTVEPGCYFIDSLLDDLRDNPSAGSLDWKRIEQLSPYGGVRIEDNIAVVDSGTRNLTRDNWPG